MESGLEIRGNKEKSTIVTYLHLCSPTNYICKLGNLVGKETLNRCDELFHHCAVKSKYLWHQEDSITSLAGKKRFKRQLEANMISMP